MSNVFRHLMQKTSFRSSVKSRVRSSVTVGALGGFMLAWVGTAKADMPPEPEDIAYGWLDRLDPTLVIVVMAVVLACFTGGVVYYIHRHFAPLTRAHSATQRNNLTLTPTDSHTPSAIDKNAASSTLPATDADHQALNTRI